VPSLSPPAPTIADGFAQPIRGSDAERNDGAYRQYDKAVRSGAEDYYQQYGVAIA
jgi:hypothetical protein